MEIGLISANAEFLRKISKGLRTRLGLENWEGWYHPKSHREQTRRMWEPIAIR